MEPKALRIPIRRRRPAPPVVVAVGLGVFAPLLLLMIVLVQVTASAGPNLVHGVINVPTTWDILGSPYVVTDTVTVMGSGVLTIEAGVEVLFDPGTQLRTVSGPLVIQGTSADPVLFTANTGSPVRGFWGGIFFEGSAVPSTLAHCVVEYATTGVSIDGDTDDHVIDHCTFRHNGDGGDWGSGGAINSTGDGLTITNNQIYDNELGLHLHKSFGNVISGNQIYANDGFGLGFIAAGATGGGNNLIAENEIYENSEFGIGFISEVQYGGGSDNQIIDNEIYDNDGGGLYGGHGLYLDWGSNNSVAGNEIYGNAGHGVWAGTQIAFQFSENVVRGNGQNGLHYAPSSLIPAALHSNVLCSNTGFNLENASTVSIVAEGNWFGTNTPAVDGGIEGSVDFTPWISMAVAASPALLPADGTSTAAFTLTMSSGVHAVPDGYTVAITVSEGTLSPSVLALNSGQATATYTAGTHTGAVDVQVTDQCATLLFTDVLTLQAVLDLSVVKVDGGLIVGPNKDYSVEYTITASNIGLVTATQVVLTDVLPLEASYSGTDWVCSPGVCEYAVGELIPSASVEVSLPLQLDKSALSCPLIVLTNTVQVADSILGGDINPTDNVFTLTTTWDDVCLPDLVVVKNDNIVAGMDSEAGWVHDLLDLDPPEPDPRDCVQVGEQITYTIAFVNSGLVTATEVVLTEMLPQHTGYIGYGWICVAGTCTRSVRDLPPGEGDVTHFVVQVNAVPPGGFVENEVHIDAAEPDLVPEDNVSYDETPVCGAGGYIIYLPLIPRGVAEPVEPPPTPIPTPTPGFVSDVAVNPETNRVYVASPQQNAVLAVDPTGDGTVTDIIPVGVHPLGLAVVTTTNKIYAANLHSWTLTPIRGSDHTPGDDIYVGAQACKVAADSGDAQVYVTNHLESDNGAAAVNSKTDEFMHYYSRLHAVAGRYGIDVDPKADQLFIAARDGGLIAIQDATRPDQDPLVVKLDPPRVPFVVAFNPATGHLFVTAPYDNLVVVLDPYSIRWDRGDWVKLRGQWVFVLDRANAGWIGEIGVGLGAEEGIAVNPLTGFVYVTNADSNTLSVLQDDADLANIRWVMDVDVGERPQGVDVDVKTNTIYVGNAVSRDLTVIDGADHTVDKTIPLD